MTVRLVTALCAGVALGAYVEQARPGFGLLVAFVTAVVVAVLLDRRL